MPRLSSIPNVLASAVNALKPNVVTRRSLATLDYRDWIMSARSLNGGMAFRGWRKRVLESPVLDMQQDIRTNLERVRERIARAAERAGRRPEDVLLVGVSKTVEAGRIRTALAAGLGALGENRVQEARGKIAELGRPVAWHLVGHLQTNKAREALELFDVIHSVDRIDLGRELDRRARARGRPVDVLVQINVGQEPSKGGWPPEAVETAVEALAALGGLRLRGLMTIPPAVERAEDARGSFRALRKLSERHGLTELSMGMSGDFEIAVEEGATMVRVGTAIFGPRPPRVPLLPER